MRLPFIAILSVATAFPILAQNNDQDHRDRERQGTVVEQRGQGGEHGRQVVVEKRQPGRNVVVEKRVQPRNAVVVSHHGYYTESPGVAQAPCAGVPRPCLLLKP